MYVSCSCLACAKEAYPTIQDALAKIAELGFRAFDLDAFENWQHVDPSRLAAGGDDWADRFAASVADSGLAVSSFNCGPSGRLNEADPAAFEQYKAEFRALLALADRVGCPNLTLQPGGVLDGVDRADQLRTMHAHLVELAEIKGNRDLTIGLEGHAHTLVEKPAEALAAMKDLWPAVGYTYDPSHPELQGIPLAATEALLDYTVHVHVRNASLGNMQETMAAGTVDFAWLIAALKDHGYDGALSIEYFSGFDADFTSTRALRERLVALGVEA